MIAITLAADEDIPYIRDLYLFSFPDNERIGFDEILRISPRGKFKVFEITLTDGMWSCCPAAIESASKCMDVGIGCIAVGFGSADHKFLKKISSMDEGALMSSVDGLSATFSTIASTISTGGFNRFIR